MFYGAQVTTLDVSNFDTSNVTNMSSMFYKSKVTILDLSSFDISKANKLNNIFKDSKVKTVYTRTETDLNKFKSAANNPSTITFLVK